MNAATKTAKFTTTRKTIDKVYVIYSKGCREALSKVTRIAKITKFTKTAKFTIIGKTIDKVYVIYSFVYLVEFNEKSQNLLNVKLKRKIVKFAKFVTAFNPGHKYS